MKKITYPQAYTVEEFSKIFKIGLKTVYKKINNGTIPVMGFGKPYRIPIKYVDELLGEYKLDDHKETRGEDYLLIQELKKRKLTLLDVNVQKTQNEYVVFTKDMNKYLFNVNIYNQDN